jgi:FKBP-type peptidyl-prolyl cis-trans isomerase FklB
MMLAGNARAQQNPAPNSKQNPAPKPATPPGAKTDQDAADESQSSSPLKTDKEKRSYAIGMDLGTKLRKQSVEVDSDLLMQGYKDALAGDKTLLTDEQVHAIFVQLGAEIRKAQEAKVKQAADANKQEGEAFLADNKSKPGVVVLPSGLQYKILTEGTGPTPTPGDSVVCDYRGTLINGKEFDSSYKRGQPATFPVTGVIKGWTEALQLMPVGSKWQLFVPAELGYGARGAGGDIGPNSTLIFEVELISIKPKPEPKAEPGAGDDKKDDTQKDKQK